MNDIKKEEIKKINHLLFKAYGTETQYGIDYLKCIGHLYIKSIGKEYSKILGVNNVIDEHKQIIC